MLFSPFTWTQFFVTVVTLTSLYYLCVLLMLYRAQLAGFLRRLSGHAVPAVSEGKESLPDDPMGKIYPANEFSVSDSSTMDFADQDQERSIHSVNQVTKEQTVHSESTICPAASFGKVADFTEELKILFQAMKEAGGDENLFNMLFSSLLDRYPDIKTSSSSSRKALINSILEMSDEIPALNLSKDKLDQLWDQYPA